MKKVFLCSLTLMLVACPVLSGQSSGIISGKVLDPQGAVIPGVTVTITSPEMQGRRSAISGSEGNYALMGLPPGTYELTAEMSGFQPDKISGVLVRPGISLEINIKMKVGGVSTTVQVSAEAATNTPIIDTANPELMFNISGEFISKLPTGTRQQWEQIWFLVPGSETGSATENFDPAIHGGSARSNVYKFDGFDIGNAFTNQGWTTQFSTEIIQDVAIKTAGIDASTPLGTGGTVNVVTKSGGNKLHGSAAFFAQPRRFNWTNVPGGKPADQAFYQPDASVGGPIIKDKTWFFGSYRRAMVDAGVPRSAAVVASFAANAFPLPDYDRLERSNRSMAKITQKLSNRSTLTFTYLNDHGWIYNSDSRDQSDQLSTINYDSGGPLYQANWSWAISPTLMFNTIYGFRSIGSHTEGRGGQDPAVVLYANTTVGAGGNLTGANVLLYTGNRSGGAWWSWGDRNQHETNGDLTWVKSGFGGRHVVQTGYQWKPQTKAYWDNVYPDSGLWYINKVKQTQADGSVKYVPFMREYVNPTRILGFNGTTSVVGFYVQDKWSPVPRLTFNLGMRFDLQRSTDNFDVARFDNWAIGPRLGLAYSITKNANDVLRLSWSRVNDLIYAQGAPSAGSLTRGYTDQWDNNLDGVWETQIVVPPVLTPQYSVTSLVDPKIKTPYMDEFHLGYTRQLPAKVALDVAYVYRNYKRPIGTLDTNIIYQNGLFVGYKNPSVNAISLTTNLRNYHTVYQSFELSLIRNIGAKWTVFTNYSLQNNVQKGHWAYDSVYKYFHPDSWFENNTLSRTHIIRMNGSYTLPWHFLTSAIYSIQSGAPNGPVITTLAAPDPAFGPRTIILSNGREVTNPLSGTTRYVYPRIEGYSRTPMLHIFNLRLGKRFNLTERQSVEIDLDLFNVFNKSTPLSWMTINKSLATWGQYSSSVQAPRAIELSARWRF